MFRIFRNEPYFDEWSLLGCDFPVLGMPTRRRVFNEGRRHERPDPKPSSGKNDRYVWTTVDGRENQVREILKLLFGDDDSTGFSSFTTTTQTTSQTPDKTTSTYYPDDEDEEEDEDGWDDGDADEPQIESKKSDVHSNPPSIFDLLDSGMNFKDVCSTSVKSEPPTSSGEAAKNPFVFIANRLTFLIKAGYPIIFDTSKIKATEGSMYVPIDEKKTFPRIENIDELGLITSQVNSDKTIQDEIAKFLDGTEYTNIYCFPDVLHMEEEDNGRLNLAIRFVVYKRKKTRNF